MRCIYVIKIIDKKRKGEKMARINATLSDSLDQEMRNYIEKNNLTITTFLHLAISKYLESQKQVKERQQLFTDLFKEQLKKEKIKA